MRVAIYARVSTKGDHQNPDNQLRPLKEWCRKRGHKVVQEYIDRESGAKSQRPAFDQMFQDAHKRQFDLLLFWSLDRLSREGAYKTLGHLDRIGKEGIEWRSYMEPYFDTLGDFKPAIIGIVSTLAKMEHQRIKDRIHAGLDRARRQGKRLGRPQRVIDKQKLQELRDAGLSYDQIALKIGCSVFTVYSRLSGKTYRGKPVT